MRFLRAAFRDLAMFSWGEGGSQFFFIFIYFMEFGWYCHSTLSGGRKSWPPAHRVAALPVAGRVWRDILRWRPRTDNDLDHTQGCPPSLQLCTAGQLAGHLCSNVGRSPSRPRWCTARGPGRSVGVGWRAGDEPLRLLDGWRRPAFGVGAEPGGAPASSSGPGGVEGAKVSPGLQVHDSTLEMNIIRGGQVRPLKMPGLRPESRKHEAAFRNVYLQRLGHDTDRTMRWLSRSVELWSYAGTAIPPSQVAGSSGPQPAVWRPSRWLGDCGAAS